MKHEKETLIDNLISIMDALLSSEDSQCRLLLLLDEAAVYGAEDARITVCSGGSTCGALNSTRNINFEIDALGQIKSKRLNQDQLRLLRQWYNICGRQLLKNHFKRIRLN